MMLTSRPHPFAALATLIVIAASAVFASATSIRGVSLYQRDAARKDFEAATAKLVASWGETESLCAASGKDASSCTSTKTNEGDDCVWCEHSDRIGVCLAPDRGDAIVRLANRMGIEGVSCGVETGMPPLTERHVPGDEETTDLEQLLATDVRDEAEKAERDESLTEGESGVEGDADDYFGDLRRCLLAGPTATACSKASGGTCAWCNTKAEYGLCVSKRVSRAVVHYQWFVCKDANDVKDKSRDFDGIDPLCLTGGPDSVSCGNSKDSKGEDCVWCDGAGVFGLCMSKGEADAASNYLTCGVSVDPFADISATVGHAEK